MNDTPEKYTAELAVDTLEETLKSEKPNKKILNKVLGALDRIPVAIEVATKIKNAAQIFGIL